MRFGVFVIVAFGLVAAVALWARGASARALEAREQQWGVAAKPGDLVFQDLECGRRCALIRDITQSRYTHVGIVLEQDGQRVVWEALGPVGPTPLAAWVRRGRGQRIAIYRPRTVDRVRLREGLAELEGRPYDANYLWDDERIYCSELVAKAWPEPFVPTPVDLGRHAREVERLSAGRLRNGEPMVSPADLIRSGRFDRIIDELRR